MCTTKKWTCWQISHVIISGYIPLCRTASPLSQSGLPLVGQPQIGPPDPAASITEIFAWHSASPFSRLAWGWQHGYINVKGYLPYYDHTTPLCAWCNCAHGGTFFGTLMSCRAVADWRSRWFEAFPPGWQKPISDWWQQTSIPEGERKLLLRGRLPESLLTTLGGSAEDILTMLKKSVPQQQEAAKAIITAARG